IAADNGQACGELSIQAYPSATQLPRDEGQHVAGSLVEVHLFAASVFLAEQGTHPPDHLTGESPVADRPARHLASADSVQGILIQHPQASTRVGDAAEERLTDLMSNGCGQCT